MIRLGRFAEAEEVVGETLRRATTTFNVAAGMNQAGYLAAVQGEFDRAEELLERAWELMQHSGGFQLIGLALAWRLSLCLWRAQAERAHRLVEEAMERITAAEGQLIYTAEVYWLAGRVHADRAEAALIRGLDAETAQAAAAAGMVAGQLAKAIATYLDGGAPPEALAFEVLLRGERERARGHNDPGPWRAAAERLSILRQPYRAAYADARRRGARAERRAAPPGR